MDFKQEEKYKEKIVELKRTIQFLHHNMAKAIKQLENGKLEYTILLLKEVIDDKRYITK